MSISHISNSIKLGQALSLELAVWSIDKSAPSMWINWIPYKRSEAISDMLRPYVVAKWLAEAHRAEKLELSDDFSLVSERVGVYGRGAKAYLECKPFKQQSRCNEFV